MRLLESMATMDEEAFVAFFGDERTWTCRLSNGAVVPLKPDGADTVVVHSDRAEYCRLVQETRMNECKEQVS